MTEAMAAAGRDVSPAAATATTNNQVPRVSKAAWWAGTIISTLIVLLMGVLPILLLLFNRAMIEDGTEKQGYPRDVAVPILIVEIVCALLYAIPRTAGLGAILLTAYLGGAVATHVRASEPWFIPVIVGVLVWLGLYLRDPRVRALVPLRKV